LNKKLDNIKMTDKNGVIKSLGTELEEIAKNPEISESTKSLMLKTMEFGYAVGGCERDFETKNDPYSAERCIRRYERIMKMLKGE
jgi:hypothetical protein